MDGETLTLVEGDLLLDIDQKELCREALNFRQAEFRDIDSIQSSMKSKMIRVLLSGMPPILHDIVRGKLMNQWNADRGPTSKMKKSSAPLEKVHVTTDHVPDSDRGAGHLSRHSPAITRRPVWQPLSARPT